MSGELFSINDTIFLNNIAIADKYIMKMPITMFNIDDIASSIIISSSRQPREVPKAARRYQLKMHPSHCVIKNMPACNIYAKLPRLATRPASISTLRIMKKS